jgi:hypothetical protein
MAAVEVTITGTLYDKANRTTQQVVLIGEASLSGVGVGGGPIIPPPSSGGGYPPSGAHPSHPIYYPDAKPEHPIVLPVPPDVTVPPPGSPPMVLPGAHPSHPMVPPQAIVVDYPGIGKVLVPQPLPATATTPT